MKLDKFLCFMFLFAFLALTLHKTRQDNQSKASTNLFEINLRTKNKRLCMVTVGSTSNCDCIVPAFEIPRVSQPVPRLNMVGLTVNVDKLLWTKFSQGIKYPPYIS